jgi:redox-sensitive bicupin YhaK (pirin superfamily)
MDRRIVRTTEAPMTPGFLGGSHVAAMRVSPEDYARNDPFFLLMDDNLEAGPAFAPMGEAHPHAGFETVTFILDGSLRDRHEGGVLGAGDLQWMTAGRGVIHSEDI